jgi:hypothetical protein
MSEKNTVSTNAVIPVIIGVVGGAVELASLKPVFVEFRNTFGDSTPVKVMLADSSGGIIIFDEKSPQVSVRLPVLVCEKVNFNQSVATYLLRNCHFVLLAATLGEKHSIRSAIVAHAIELPVDMQTVEGEGISVFDLPDPAPVMAQLTENTLSLEIMGRDVRLQDEDAAKSNEGKTFMLALFDYAESKPFWKTWFGLVNGSASEFKNSSAKKVLLFTRGARDEMGARWLSCAEAIHRQAEFNKENWTDSTLNSYQTERFGFKSVDEIPHDSESCDLRNLFLIQSKADTLATTYQAKWQKLRFSTMKEISTRFIFLGGLFSFLWLSVIAAFLFVASTEFGSLLGGWVNIIASLGYVLIMLGTFVIYLYARKKSWEKKHQDYRFIAEVLAIQLHWLLGGIRKYASDHFPTGVKNDVQWVRRAVHASRFLSKLDETKSTLTVDKVCKQWVSEQKDWHKTIFQQGREKAFNTLNMRRNFAGIIFVVSFLIFACFSSYEGYALLNEIHGAKKEQSLEIMADSGSTTKREDVVATLPLVVEHKGAVVQDEVVGVVTKSDGQGDGEESKLLKERLETFHHCLVVFMVVSLVLYALLGEAIEGYGIEQELTRSEALVEVYDRCLREFNKLDGDGEKRKILMQVGGFAIEAEANWLVVHRERPMQPVKGG